MALYSQDVSSLPRRAFLLGLSQAGIPIIISRQRHVLSGSLGDRLTL